MSKVTISGAISGLDTAGLINQLVEVQKSQQTILTTQQSAVRKRSDAYASLLTSLTALGTQAADLAKTSAWAGATVTSSSSSVTATSTATKAGRITFDVTSVASAHALVSASAVGSTGSTVAGEGVLVLTTSDGAETEILVGNGTLDEVVSGINASGTGLVAQAVRVGSAGYRLQVTATAGGAASEFTLTGFDGFAVEEGVEPMSVLTQASDARITIGTNPLTAYEVTSPTNTFAELVPGVSFTVSKEETRVTVASTVDGSSIADKVGKLVDAANAILSDIATKTAYDSKTKSGGPLTGESTVRLLQQNLLSTVSSAGATGVQLTRNGRLSFDRAAFLSAFAADPAKVANTYGAAGVFTPVSESVTGTTTTVTGATKTARPGTYDLQVDTLPEREQWAFGVGDEVEGSVFSLVRGGTTISFAAGAGAVLADVAAGLNARSAAAGFGVTASLDDGTLLLTADSPGSGAAFTALMDDLEGEQVVAGTDISGSIDGQAATGLGNVLSLLAGTGGAVGLSIAVNTTADDVGMTAGALGALTYTPGLAQRLSTLVSDATAASTGAVPTARDGADSQVKRYQDLIDAWDARLVNYRQSLVRQFTAMETALAKLKSATSALSGLIRQTSSESES